MSAGPALPQTTTGSRLVALRLWVCECFGWVFPSQPKADPLPPHCSESVAQMGVSVLPGAISCRGFVLLDFRNIVAALISIQIPGVMVDNQEGADFCLNRLHLFSRRGVELFLSWLWPQMSVSTALSDIFSF